MEDMKQMSVAPGYSFWMWHTVATFPEGGSEGEMGKDLAVEGVSVRVL